MVARGPARGGVVARDLADGRERWRWPAADAIVRAIAATSDGWLVHRRPFAGGPATIAVLGLGGAVREEVGGAPGDVLALLGGDACVRGDGARWNWRLGRVIG